MPNVTGRMTRQEIIEEMRLTGKPSYAWLQNKLKISFKEAKRICDGLVYEKENIYITRMNEYLEKING